jgi:hypothetical protein
MKKNASAVIASIKLLAYASMFLHSTALHEKHVYPSSHVSAIPRAASSTA